MKIYGTFNSRATIFLFRYILLPDTILERRNLHGKIVLFNKLNRNWLKQELACFNLIIFTFLCEVLITLIFNQRNKIFLCRLCNITDNAS